MERGKTSLLAAVAGAVVGAGAVIASVIALKDHKNQQKVKKIITGAKAILQTYSDNVADQVDDSKVGLKKMANRAINKAEKVTK